MKTGYIVEVGEGFGFVAVSVKHFAKSLLYHRVSWNNSQ